MVGFRAYGSHMGDFLAYGSHMVGFLNFRLDLLQMTGYNIGE